MAHTPRSRQHASPVGGLGVFVVPLALTGGLLALGLLPRVRESGPVAWSFWGAAIGLLAWQGLLAVRALGEGARELTFAPPRPQHYIQTCCQLSIYGYWGWFWLPVYDFAPLLIGQLVFAYAFDLLLAWSRARRLSAGLRPGAHHPQHQPLPLVQGRMVPRCSLSWWRWAFLGKAFVRWDRDGRRVHIFNPSSFALAVFSVVLLATGTTNITWGQEIATTFGMGPQAYLLMFIVGLVVMYFFATTPVTATAAATLFAGSAIYTGITGVPYFVDSEIPAAVFLGLHLLVTDPSTSPRTPLGRVIFGVLYGVGVGHPVRPAQRDGACRRSTTSCCACRCST